MNSASRNLSVVLVVGFYKHMFSLSMSTAINAFHTNKKVYLLFNIMRLKNNRTNAFRLGPILKKVMPLGSDKQTIWCSSNKDNRTVKNSKSLVGEYFSYYRNLSFKKM